MDVKADTIGTPFVERLSSLGGYFVQSVCTFGVSFVGRFFLFQSVLYRRFYCSLLACMCTCLS